MEKRFNLKLHEILKSEYIGGRIDGSFIRKQIENILDSEPKSKVIIDFEGIIVASHSLIDEIIGYPLRLKGKTFLNHIKFRNANPSIKITIKTVLNDSLQKAGSVNHNTD